MKFWWTTTVILLLLVSPQRSPAQSSNLRQPPRIQPPIGIDPNNTTLPGQRQGVPFFGPPKIGERSGTSGAQPPASTKPKPSQTPTAPIPGSAVPPETEPAKPSTEQPAKLPEVEAQPPVEPPPRVIPETEPGPIGPYVPGGMQGPASFDPNVSPAPLGIGAYPGSYGGYGGFDAALRAPPFVGAPGVPPCSGNRCGRCCNRCCADPCCCDPFWFGVAGGLIMGRNDPNRSWLSAQKSDYANQIMNGADAAAPWTGGWEWSAGWFSPTCGALAFTYWGLAPTTGYDHVYLPGDLVTPINLNDVYIDGVGADYFYDNAQEHRVWRYDEINDIELNFLSLPATRPGGGLQISWLAGVRYFRFRDRLLFGAVHEGFEWGSDGGVNEAYLDVAMANNLIGGQVGAFVNWMLGQRFGLFLMPRVGVYANNINQHFQLYRGDGFSSIDIGTQKTVGALIGQIDFGVNYFFTPNWSVYVGYRVMAASGVGLADAQIPAFLIDTPEIKAIESNGDLILQGGTAGLLFLF